MHDRIFYSNNGILEDIGFLLNNYHAGSKTFASFVASEDALYIGSRLPFNHFFLKVNSVNTNDSNMKISYWDSSKWSEVAEVVDLTKTGLKTLSQSGFVTLVPSKHSNWIREDTNYSGNSVDDLTSIEVYDKYWLKITFSNDLSANTSIEWIGQKFSDDYDLGSEYSDLVRPEMIDAFESGKTDYEEQHVKAAEIIVQDLIDKKIICEKDQILDRNDFKLASVSKVAEIIYNSMGDDYSDNKDNARNEYRSRLKKTLPRVDTNKNAREDIREKFHSGSLYR